MILQGGPLNRTNQINKQITVDLINISKILYKSATLFKTVKHIGQNNSHSPPLKHEGPRLKSAGIFIENFLSFF